MEKLTDEEMALWQAWKLASETVRTHIAADITAATGLSDPDFGVLTRVVELSGGRMRQNRLAELMGYHRSRLSHHLARMEERGLISREAVGSGMEVVATAAGREAVALARPVHAAAVREHLIEPLRRADPSVFLAGLRELTPSK
ncbi:MarR family winged helix-turn-helix transcriptional regulator [Kutzneria buriramensis]|uniref:MarR family protein n=1 Tax=Kutzneria buriramensis TaxID=1045776 RepID=A0A3E0GZR8_9PSEU|nr:MarR family transcriptional regulator [Kutzneria buriramensis]REH35657.1 MarR family protein [Kutzneria buriramensis]